jgi:hypothetical protein
MYKCPEYTVKIKYVRASRLPGKIYTERVGIDTLNLKLDRDVPCGIYKLYNTYGEASMFVGNNNPRFGYLYMKNLEALKNVDMLDLWDLTRIDASDNAFIRTYDRGCCD